MTHICRSHPGIDIHIWNCIHRVCQFPYNTDCRNHVKRGVNTSCEWKIGFGG